MIKIIGLLGCGISTGNIQILFNDRKNYLYYQFYVNKGYGAALNTAQVEPGTTVSVKVFVINIQKKDLKLIIRLLYGDLEPWVQL